MGAGGLRGRLGLRRFRLRFGLGRLRGGGLPGLRSSRLGSRFLSGRILFLLCQCHHAGLAGFPAAPDRVGFAASLPVGNDLFELLGQLHADIVRVAEGNAILDEGQVRPWKPLHDPVRQRTGKCPEQHHQRHQGRPGILVEILLGNLMDEFLQGTLHVPVTEILKMVQKFNLLGRNIPGQLGFVAAKHLLEGLLAVALPVHDLVQRHHDVGGGLLRRPLADFLVGFIQGAPVRGQQHPRLDLAKVGEKIETEGKADVGLRQARSQKEIADDLDFPHLIEPLMLRGDVVHAGRAERFFEIRQLAGFGHEDGIGQPPDPFEQLLVHHRFQNFAVVGGERGVFLQEVVVIKHHGETDFQGAERMLDDDEVFLNGRSDRFVGRDPVVNVFQQVVHFTANPHGFHRVLPRFADSLAGVHLEIFADLLAQLPPGESLHIPLRPVPFGDHAGVGGVGLEKIFLGLFQPYFRKEFGTVPGGWRGGHINGFHGVLSDSSPVFRSWKLRDRQPNFTTRTYTAPRGRVRLADPNAMAGKYKIAPEKQVVQVKPIGIFFPAAISTRLYQI